LAKIVIACALMKTCVCDSSALSAPQLNISPIPAAQGFYHCERKVQVT
jgi:hypothetical protein